MTFLCSVRILAVTGFAYGLTQEAWAGSVTLTAVEDTSLRQKEPDLTHGSLVTMWVGTSGQLDSSRSLIRFDLSTNIPAGAIVTSCSLTVNVVGMPPAPVNSVFALRRALRSWSEAGATWTNRLSSTTPWSIPGAASPLDYVSAATQTNFIIGTGFHDYASNSNMVADVQTRVSNPGSNFGWILMSESQGTAYTEKNSPRVKTPTTRPGSPSITPCPSRRPC